MVAASSTKSRVTLSSLSPEAKGLRMSREATWRARRGSAAGEER